MIVLFLSGLFGCASESAGSITTASDAPWNMNDAVTFLFTPGPNNSGRVGSGVLAISTDSGHGCGDVASGPPAGGSGLWFELGYDTGRSEGAASPAWDGLYASGEVKAENAAASRSLSVSGWHQGFVYSFEGSDAWLNVSHGSQDQFEGRFSTNWWSGEFDADVCPKAPDPADQDESNDDGSDDDGDTGDAA